MEGKEAHHKKIPAIVIPGGRGHREGVEGVKKPSRFFADVGEKTLSPSRFPLVSILQSSSSPVGSLSHGSGWRIGSHRFLRSSFDPGMLGTIAR